MRNKISRTIAMLPVILLVFLQIMVPAMAATPEGEEGWYGIGIQVIAAEGAAPLNDTQCMQAGFMLADANTGEYIVGEYDTATNAYMVAGKTINDSEGTVFQGGTNSEAPEMIQIFGLQKGTYILSQVGAPEGYIKLPEAVSIVISEDGAYVDGYDVSLEETESGYKIASLKIVMTHGFKLPGNYSESELKLLQYVGAVLLVGSITGIVLLLWPKTANNTDSDSVGGQG